MRLSLVLALALALGGCSSGGKAPANAGGPPGSRGAACAAINTHLTSFGELLETTSANAKTHASSYAGLLELLLSFESASSDLDTALSGVKPPGGDLDARLKTAHGTLEKAAQFARSERDAVEKHAREVAPLARDTQQAWAALRTACGPKGGPPDCGGIREALVHFDAAESSEQHEKAVAELAAVRVVTPGIVKARDRAVQASRTVQKAIKARAEVSAPVPQRWTAVQKELAVAMEGLVEGCKGSGPVATPLVAAARPDPRRLTVLVHVKPPAGVEKSLLSLAKAAADEDERAFYEARAEGAFGSGFFLVRKTEKGSEVLVVTNRHVVELGDRAALQLADGTTLGLAEIVYSNPLHDLAILRPATKVSVSEGFAFAAAPAKDQQTVIATGFPGLVGRPSYQTTKGYVSNESFRLDDGHRPLTYVQHTAPIDPGSSGGPLTDEAGHVLGVNTLKVTGREGVGLAVPSRYVVDTLRTASLVEVRHASAPNRQKEARLSCLGFVAELGAQEPRMLVVEQMISNRLVGAEGMEAALALASEEGFDHLWSTDSVRAMRIATLMKVRSAFMLGGGPSILETCDDVDAASLKPDFVKYHVRLGNFETRDLALRWEHGRWKIDGFSSAGGGGKRPLVAPKKLPPPGPPAGGVVPRKVAPPRR